MTSITGVGGHDPLTQALFEYLPGTQGTAGQIAVSIFFFISGLLVTNSLVNKHDLVGFVAARILRIYPDLPPVYVPGPMLVTARSEGPLLFLEGLFLPEGGRPLAQVAGSPMRCAA